MKYSILHVIEGEPKKELEGLRSDIEEEFGFGRIQFKTFPHLTIKYDFNADHIEEVEKVVDEFRLRKKPLNLVLSGVGVFDRKVVFLKVRRNSELIRTYKDLCEELSKIKWLTWELYEREDFIPHFTLAYKQLSASNFSSVFRYVKKKRIVVPIHLDNLAITKLENGERVVHKLYKLI